MATSCTNNNVLQSLYVFKNFTFDFIWDYANEKLIMSLDTKDGAFLFPGELHPFIGRTKLLTTSLGSQEQEIFKRKAMQKSIQRKRQGEENPFDDVIGIDEMMTKSAGPAVLQVSSKVINELDPNASNNVESLQKKTKVGSLTKEKLGSQVTHQTHKDHLAMIQDLGHGKSTSSTGMSKNQKAVGPNANVMSTPHSSAVFSVSSENSMNAKNQTKVPVKYSQLVDVNNSQKTPQPKGGANPNLPVYNMKQLNAVSAVRQDGLPDKYKIERKLYKNLDENGWLKVGARVETDKKSSKSKYTGSTTIVGD
jgi:hypothetical protein